MKVKINVGDVWRALGCQTNCDKILELEAEPIEKAKWEEEFDKTLRAQCMDGRIGVLYDVDGSRTKDFIRKLLREFAEECKELASGGIIEYSLDPRYSLYTGMDTVKHNIDTVLKKYLNQPKEE